MLLGSIFFPTKQFKAVLQQGLGPITEETKKIIHTYICTHHGLPNSFHQIHSKDIVWHGVNVEDTCLQYGAVGPNLIHVVALAGVCTMAVGERSSIHPAVDLSLHHFVELRIAYGKEYGEYMNFSRTTSKTNNQIFAQIPPVSNHSFT